MMLGNLLNIELLLFDVENVQSVTVFFLVLLNYEVKTKCNNINRGEITTRDNVYLKFT